MKRRLRTIWRWVTGDWYEVRRTRAPLRPGFGAYNPRRRMVLKPGLRTREEAQAICDRENRPESGC